jgi:hypothetical protein
MARNTLYMGATEITPVRTQGEIIALLVRHGARQVALDYDAAGKAIGLHFMMQVQSIPMVYRLPVRMEGVYKKIHGARKQWVSGGEARDREQAERVAWRQLLRWLEAQFAMADLGMVKPDEVLLPYLTEPGGRTIYEYFVEQGYKALPAPGGNGQ